MNYLVDTHAVLWMMFEPKKLSQKVQAILTDKELHKFISMASLWEIAIKNRIGKLPLYIEISELFTSIEALGIGQVGIGQRHVEIFNVLPIHHRDPFDGIIIATAIFEDMIIITNDENIQKYDIKWTW